jgi:hypothetical protein
VRRDADLLLALAAAAVLTVLTFRGGDAASLAPFRASWELTPGALNPDVTQATIAQTVCKAGWTRTVRPPTDYTNDLKRKQMTQYGRIGDLADYQEDHLISLELGGNPTDPGNLWPEPYPRAADVDREENRLNGLVCSGELTLAEAQARESTMKHTAG